MRAGGGFDDLTRAGGDGEGVVAAALERLEGDARLVLALLFIEGLNEAEVAAALDRTVDDVRALAGAAQRALAFSVAGLDARRAA